MTARILSSAGQLALDGLGQPIAVSGTEDVNFDGNAGTNTYTVADFSEVVYGSAASPLSVRERLVPRSVLHRAHRRPVPHDDAAAPDGRGGGVGDVSERSDAIPARTGGGSAPPSGR